jgi:hypothetical protein
MTLPAPFLLSNPEYGDGMDVPVTTPESVRTYVC